MTPDILIAYMVIILVAAHRFSVSPPPKPSLPAGIPRQLGTILNWFQFTSEPKWLLFPPPRANTTLFQFWLYRLAYVLCYLLAFLAIIKVPGLADQVRKVIEIAAGQDTSVLLNAGPVVLAFVVSVVIPFVPPFKGAERSLRRALYERASIPAQQFRERSRLKHADYQLCPATYAVVRDKLEAERFDRRDIIFEAIPTTRSLWTKASLLMQHLEAWQGKDRYKTAFAVLREPDSHQLSVEQITDAYKALKGNARACFKARRGLTGESETERREDQFRRQCKELLVHIYDLLSRVSLKSHITDRERVACMEEIGFKLEMREGGPVPDPNDLIALALVLAVVCILPLSMKLGICKALIIACITFSAVLVPILIANRFPAFVLGGGSKSPCVAFPFVSGLIAAAIAIAFSVTHSSFDPNAAADGALVFDISRGLQSYIERSYPWTSLPTLYAILVASRIRTGTYPNTANLKGIKRYAEWGSLLDAAIFATCGLVVMAVFVRPTVAQLWGIPATASDWKLLLRPTIIAAVLGFLIPTWYRANVSRRKAKSMRQKRGRGKRKIIPSAYGI